MWRDTYTYDVIRRVYIVCLSINLHLEVYDFK